MVIWFLKPHHEATIEPKAIPIELAIKSSILADLPTKGWVISIITPIAKTMKMRYFDQLKRRQAAKPSAVNEK